ncbi:hypothetical protein [Arcticibacterium luteifluviistationis]|uniref:Uncharacterized protein n=1 Tax=Arcticibacterium luteifluviistationis TaxID=1784714 RepID=A0A2Z4GB41_9BACT|nr:hypothetical protein [Arcticibacterium luteifluviistationis]AWV98417.1 hypothetical protein DJ013_09620 [Arcticibacterium luteifluviistationis]
MKRVLIVLILSSVFVFSSGFGAVENNSYVRTESVSSERNVVKVEYVPLEVSVDVVNGEFEQALILDTSDSFSEKLGVLIVESFISVLQYVSALLLNLVH